MDDNHKAYQQKKQEQPLRVIFIHPEIYIFFEEQHSHNARSVKQHYGTSLIRNCIKFLCKKAMPIRAYPARFRTFFSCIFHHHCGKIQIYFIQFCTDSGGTQTGATAADIRQRCRDYLLCSRINPACGKKTAHSRSRVGRALSRC
ncbi:hypothetical protein [Desulfovibrio sp.]|uniref:hypothetical protein n=1 Tax=Desulfovibrio sp. TaxID=885 RepID=UPI003D0DAEC4